MAAAPVCWSIKSSVVYQGAGVDSIKRFSICIYSYNKRKHSRFMHGLSLNDNQYVRLFTSFNTKVDTQCKMTADFFFFTWFT